MQLASSCRGVLRHQLSCWDGPPSSTRALPHALALQMKKASASAHTNRRHTSTNTHTHRRPFQFTHTDIHERFYNPFDPPPHPPLPPPQKTGEQRTRNKKKGEGEPRRKGGGRENAVGDRELAPGRAHVGGGREALVYEEPPEDGDLPAVARRPQGQEGAAGGPAVVGLSQGEGLRLRSRKGL